MTLSKKFFALATAAALGIGAATHVVAADPPAQDSQAIINSLIQNLNQLQTAQASTTQQTPANNNTQVAQAPTQPVNPVANPNQLPVAPVQPAVNSQPQVNSGAAPSSGGVLTNDNMMGFLQSLGYDQVEKIADNKFKLTMVRNGWYLYSNVLIDTYANKVWLFSYMREIKDASNASADKFVKILEANNLIGPSHFYMLNGALYLGRAFENSGVTPARFRNELDQFYADAQRTEELWTASAWETTNAAQVTTTTPPAAPAPTP
jgi:hypothetical protein